MKKLNTFYSVVLILVMTNPSTAQTPASRRIIEAKNELRTVALKTMQRVYEQVKTPYKYGVILKGENKTKIDCPTVFRHENRWYMTYIAFDGTGYETYMAESTNLLDWSPLGKILGRRHGNWDSSQVGGYATLQDPQWGGSYQLLTHDGKYWLSYLGGAEQGYERGKLSIGIAWTKTPAVANEWTRLEGPVMTPDDDDTRWWEKGKLFKSTVVFDEQRTLGHPYVMFYNAKDISGKERIGMAVSDDMTHWKRYLTDPVLSHVNDGWKITGDVIIQKIGNLWVAFYFGYLGGGGPAFDNFACSYDLVHWTPWYGPKLIEPSEPYDSKYAHKPFMIKHNGIVYHFYCAVGDQGRVIALATSRDLQRTDHH